MWPLKFHSRFKSFSKDLTLTNPVSFTEINLKRREGAFLVATEGERLAFVISSSSFSALITAGQPPDLMSSREEWLLCYHPSLGSWRYWVRYFSGSLNTSCLACLYGLRISPKQEGWANGCSLSSWSGSYIIPYPFILFIWKRVKIMLEMELSLNFFFFKEESIIDSAFKSHLCRLNLGLSWADTFFFVARSYGPV